MRSGSECVRVFACVSARHGTAGHGTAQRGTHMGSFSRGLLFVSYLSNRIREIFQTYSDRHLVGAGELWRSRNFQGKTMFTVPKILC